MWKWGLRTLLLLSIGFAGPLEAEDQPLEAIRREVDESNHQPAKKPRKPTRERLPCRPRNEVTFSWSGSAGDNFTGDDSDSDSIAGWIVLGGLTAPWWGPHVFVEDDDAGAAQFPVAPYADGADGYLQFDDEAVDTRAWGGRFSVDTASDFDDITTMAGRLRLDSVFRLGIDTEWAHLQARSGTDSLTAGDFNLVVRFAQSPRVQFHSGLGLNWLGDRGSSDFGWNFTYGVDLFPVEPVVVSTTIDLGIVGDASLIHLRSTLGMMITPRVQLYSGYDLRDYEGITVHSLLTGLEIWF